MATDSLNRAAVKALMDALGVDSVAALARRSGIERTYLSRILDGKRPAQASHVIAIAVGLKVPPIAITGPCLDPAAAEALEVAS